MVDRAFDFFLHRGGEIHAEAIIDEAIYTGYLVARDLDLEFDYGWES